MGPGTTGVKRGNLARSGGGFVTIFRLLLDQILVLLAKVALALIGVFVALMGLLVVTRARRPFPIDGAWELGGEGWEQLSARAGWRRHNRELAEAGWTALGTARIGAGQLAAWLSPCRRVIATVLGQGGHDAVAMTSLGAGGERVRTVNQPVGHLPTSPRGQLLWKATPGPMYSAHLAAFGDGAQELEAGGAIAALRASSERAIDALVPTGWLAWAGEGRARAMFTWRGAVASVRTDQRLAELARRARGAAVTLPAAMGRPWRAIVVIAGAILCSGVLYLGWARSARVCGARGYAPIAIAAPVTEGAPALAWADAVILGGVRTAVTQEPAGELALPSGQLVVGDAEVTLAAPIAVEIPPGTYPVVLSVAGGQVAFARVELTGTEPVGWIASGMETEGAAYAVGSGAGVFVDRGGEGGVRFAVGRDGSFPVYVGYDAEGRVAAVVTQLVPVAPL